MKPLSTILREVAVGLAVAWVAAAPGAVAQESAVQKVTVAQVAKEIGAAKGAPTVVLLYGSACSLSEKMFPEFVRVAREYEPRGVRFLAYSTDKPGNVYWIPSFLKANRASFEPVVIHRWASGELTREMKPLGIEVGSTWTRPLVAVRDREGRVVFQSEGETDLAPLRKALAKAVK